jgi:hypothetical protein
MTYSFDNIVYSHNHIKLTATLHTNNMDNTWTHSKTPRKQSDNCKKVCHDGNPCHNRSYLDKNNFCKLKKCDSEIYDHKKYRCGGDGPKDCYNLGSYVIYGDFVQCCGTFNPTTTCTLKLGNQSKLYGSSTGTLKSTDWDTYWKDIKILDNGEPVFPGKDNAKLGYAKCVYTFDTSKLEFGDPTSNQDCSQFLLTMISGTNNVSMYGKGLNEGAEKMGRWLGMIGLYFLPTHFWFQKLYETDHFDYISSGEDTRSQIFTSILSSYYEVFEKLDLDKWSDPVKNLLNSYMTIPQVVKNDDSIGLNIPLSYHQYLDFSKSSNKPGVISKYLAYMLNDSDSKYPNKEDHLKNIIPEFKINNNLPTSVNGIEIDPKTFKVTASQNKSWDYIGENRNMFVLTYNISVTITKWTAMLMVLVLRQYKDGEDLPVIISDKMKEDTNFLPLLTYKTNCNESNIKDNEELCLNMIKNNCGAHHFIKPGNYSVADINDNLFVGDAKGGSNICQCYNSLLQPVINREGGNITAMCFDKSCDKNAISLFNLNNELCRTNCNQITDWMQNHDKNDPGAGANPAYLDKTKYRTICGSDFKPFVNKSFNISFTTYLVSSGLGILLILYAYLYMSKAHRNNVILIMSIVSLVVVGLIIFLSIDIIGNPTCSGDKYPKASVCKSKITKIKIPNDFCDFLSPCECINDNDCAGDCICINSTCVPESGDSAYTQTQNGYIIYWRLVSSISLLIIGAILFILSLYVFKNYMLSVLVFSCFLMVVFWSMLYAFVKKVEVKYENKCKK